MNPRFIHRLLGLLGGSMKRRDFGRVGEEAARKAREQSRGCASADDKVPVEAGKSAVREVSPFAAFVDRVWNIREDLFLSDFDKEKKDTNLLWGKTSLERRIYMRVYATPAAPIEANKGLLTKASRHLDDICTDLGFKASHGNFWYYKKRGFKESRPQWRVYINPPLNKVANIVEIIFKCAQQPRPERDGQELRLFGMPDRATPGRFPILAVKFGKDGGRPDQIVVYVDGNSNQANGLARLIADKFALLDEIPPMTLKVARGISIGMEPTSPVFSFGSLRSHLVAQALFKACANLEYPAEGDRLDAKGNKVKMGTEAYEFIKLQGGCTNLLVPLSGSGRKALDLGEARRRIFTKSALELFREHNIMPEAPWAGRVAV
jgi:hypothetical protein